MKRSRGKRDFKENPECIFSIKQTMRKFVDCLNSTEIFNEKIPYLIIQQSEKRMSSELEVKLTFKENIIANCTEKQADKVNNQIFEYVSKKLDELPNFSFEYGETIIKIIDKTNIDHYRSYLVAFNVWIFDDVLMKENTEIDNVCKLKIRIHNKDIPNFEIVNIKYQ